MLVEVIDTCPRGISKVEANIEAQRVVKALENCKASLHKWKKCRIFVRIHFSWVFDVPFREDQQMSSVVGIKIGRNGEQFIFPDQKADDPGIFG